MSEDYPVRWLKSLEPEHRAFLYAGFYNGRQAEPSLGGMWGNRMMAGMRIGTVLIGGSWWARQEFIWQMGVLEGRGMNRRVEKVG